MQQSSKIYKNLYVLDEYVLLLNVLVFISNTDKTIKSIS